MKNILFLLTVFFVLACNNTTSDTADGKPGDEASAKPLSKDSVFAQDLRAFREAVYQNNRERVKSFFSFPVMNVNNEIWYIASSDNLDASPGSDKIIPFTSTDFDKFYDKLFPKEFIQGILKIKVNDVVKAGEFSHEFEMGDKKTICSMYASLSRPDSLLTLNLGYKEKIEPGQDEEPVMSEMNYIYHFRMLDDGHLVFKEIRVAG